MIFMIVNCRSLWVSCLCVVMCFVGFGVFMMCVCMVWVLSVFIIGWLVI